MPVQTGRLNRRVIDRSEFAFSGKKRQYGEHADTDDHVKRMETGHDEIEQKKQTRLLRTRTGPLNAGTGYQPFDEFLMVFVGFDAQKDGSQKHGDDQQEHQLSPIV